MANTPRQPKEKLLIHHPPPPPLGWGGGGLKKIIQKKYQNIAGKAGNAKKAFPVFYLTRANAYMAKFKRIRT